MKDIIRVISLNYEFPPIGGGAGRAHQHLLEEFAGRDDLCVDVLTSGLDKGLAKEEIAENITIYRVGIHKKHLHHWRKTEVLEWLWRAGVHYRRMLGENDYDVAHAFFGFPTGWLCYRRADELPYIISLRGSDVPGVNVRLTLDYKLLGPIFRRIWSGAALLVANSAGLRERALRFLPTGQIEVIPNGVQADRFVPGESHVDRGELRLLTVGRLSATKRVELLIAATGLIRQRLPSVRLTIVGGGALEDALRQVVRKEGLEASVTMTGRLEADELPGVYQNHDLFVSASEQEGMSNAMLEAMASGLPIVTTRCEGVAELIGANGVVVEDANAESLAAAVQELADDPTRRQQMALAARKRAEQFSWAAVAEQYIERYRLVKAGRDSRRG